MSHNDLYKSIEKKIADTPLRIFTGRHKAKERANASKMIEIMSDSRLAYLSRMLPISCRGYLPLGHFWGLGFGFSLLSLGVTYSRSRDGTLAFRLSQDLSTVTDKSDFKDPMFLDVTSMHFGFDEAECVINRMTDYLPKYFRGGRSRKDHENWFEIHREIGVTPAVLEDMVGRALATVFKVPYDTPNQELLKPEYRKKGGEKYKRIHQFNR